MKNIAIILLAIISISVYPQQKTNEATLKVDIYELTSYQVKTIMDTIVMQIEEAPYYNQNLRFYISMNEDTTFITIGEMNVYSKGIDIGIVNHKGHDFILRWPFDDRIFKKTKSRKNIAFRSEESYDNNIDKYDVFCIYRKDGNWAYSIYPLQHNDF